MDPGSSRSVSADDAAELGTRLLGVDVLARELYGDCDLNFELRARDADATGAGHWVLKLTAGASSHGSELIDFQAAALRHLEKAPLRTEVPRVVVPPQWRAARARRRQPRKPSLAMDSHLGRGPALGTSSSTTTISCSRASEPRWPKSIGVSWPSRIHEPNALPGGTRCTPSQGVPASIGSKRRLTVGSRRSSSISWPRRRHAWRLAPGA